jgi:formate hydrogenlyase subunit 3/multisubunit Na+/H+ antiporter MnhD subunit
MTDLLPLLLVAIPLVGAAGVALLGPARPRVGDGVALAAVSAGVVGSITLLAGGGAEAMSGIALPALVGTIHFRADPLGRFVAVVAAVVWWSATLASLDTLKGDRRRVRYHIASLAALSAMLGVVLAANLITLFVCFEVLGLTAWFLVTHSDTAEARAAGTVYIWMTLLGGSLLLGGILLVYGAGGASLYHAVPDAGSSSLRVAAAILLVGGFGVKAGMLPLHVWLPGAHSAAPAPASAILSGVLIKAGAFGILRTLITLYPDAGSGTGVPGPGQAVMWLGLAAMLLGAAIAFGQRHAKRLLAWSSVSQMGIILVGIGVATAGGIPGGMGLAGATVQIASHAMLKACLFLGVGAVVHQAGTAELARLGGLWQRMPITFAIMLFAGTALAGMPLLTGALGKGLVHHGLDATAPPFAEWVFRAAAVGTAAVVTRLIVMVFLARPSPGGRFAGVREAPRTVLVAMAVLLVPVLLIAARTPAFLSSLVAPVLTSTGQEDAALSDYLRQYHLNLPEQLSVLTILVLGVAICFMAQRLGWLGGKWPAPLTGLYWYRAAARGLWVGSERMGWVYAGLQRATIGSRVLAESQWAGLIYAGIQRATIGSRVLAGSQRIGMTYERARKAPQRFRPIPTAGPGRVRARWADATRPLRREWQALLAESTHLAARDRVERYVRELGGNIAVIFVLFLLFLALLVWWP